MKQAQLAAVVADLARRYPGEHPFTLALRLQAETGRVITGQEAARLLRDAKS